MAGNRLGQDDLEPLLTPLDVSGLLAIPVKTLYRWHHVGVGPECLVIGRHLRYRPQAIRDFLKQAAS